MPILLLDASHSLDGDAHAVTRAAGGAMVVLGTLLLLERALAA